MNAEDMRSALIAFADLVGGSPRADRLRRFAALFEAMGKAKVTSIVATIATNWKASGRVPRYPSQLRDDLTAVYRALECSTAKAQAKVVMALLELFRGSDNQVVEAFVDETIAARIKKPSHRVPRATPTFTSEQARNAADQLISAADDRYEFEILLQQLKAHRKTAELRTIARFYTGYETTKTKKDDIIVAIRDWQREGEMNRDRRASQAKTGV